jgi:hypothetical protein
MKGRLERDDQKLLYVEGLEITHQLAETCRDLWNCTGHRAACIVWQRRPPEYRMERCGVYAVRNCPLLQEPVTPPLLRSACYFPVSVANFAG